MLDTASRPAGARQRVPLRRPTGRTLANACASVVLLLVALVALPDLLSIYYIDAMTQVAVYSMAALGLGLLVGRVGLVSLGQVAVLAIGAWVAGGITIVLTTTNFPNGGHGFLGYNGSLVHIPAIRRPVIAASDPGYYRYSVVVAALMFLLVIVHLRTRPGRAWAAIRQSEPAALAAGINATLYKLWAFALASFITGVAGGVLAGAVQYLYSIDFPTQDSITLLAVVLMGGVYSLWGALVAALLLQLLPALLHNWGVSADWLTILFGIGVVQVLTTAPGGLADQVPKDLARLGRLVLGVAGRLRPGSPSRGGPP